MPSSSSSSSSLYANALHVVPLANPLLSLVGDFTSHLGEMLSESGTLLPFAFHFHLTSLGALVIFVSCFIKHLLFYL